MSSAVGSACADLRQLLRVFTRPVIGRFSRLGLRSSRAHLTACAPGALAPSPRRRFHRAGRLSDALPGPSGSISPEAMHSKFASPRNRVRVCGDLPAGPRSSRDWLPRRGSWPKPLPRRLERHVDQRPDILSFGRLQDLPLAGASALSLRCGRCRITFPKIVLRALKTLGRLSDCVPDGVGWRRSF